MIISCKCLNIAIIIPNDNHISSTTSSKSNEQFQIDKYKFLNKCFANDEEEVKLIFIKKVDQIDGMENIRMLIELNELVQIKLIKNKSTNNNNNNNYDDGDEWNIYKCLNCNSITHGLCNINNNNENNTPDNNLIALNCAYQIPATDYNKMKQSNGFSPIFNIIITKPLLNLNIFGTGRNDKILPKLATLKDRYHNFLVTQMKATEQRISEYREKETQLFNEFKYRGEQEYNLLVSLISNAPDDNTNIDKLTSSPKITHLDTPPTTPDSAPIECSPPFKQQKTQWPSSGLPPISTTRINKISEIQIQQQKQSPNNKSLIIKPHPSVINDSNKNTMTLNSTLTAKFNKLRQDTDCLFDLDDDLVNDIDANHDDNDDYFNSSQNNTLVDYDLNLIDDIDNDDDIDDLDDINPIRQYTKQQSITLAKSLPISMPILASGMHTNDHELDDDEKTVEDNIDIAASIKALAKSVHGDTVFGDLPRPRFSTQI